MGAEENGRVAVSLLGGIDAIDLVQQRTIDGCTTDGSSLSITLVIDGATYPISPSLALIDSVDIEGWLLFPRSHMHRPYWKTVDAFRSS
jgi:hypothetical protein